VTQIASVMALVFSPVLYWLTIKAVKDNFKAEFEIALLPSKLMFAWAWTGTVALVCVTAYLFYMRFGPA
jgi:hypothetical protein